MDTKSNLPPNKVYQGGSAMGVSCAHCQATHTSGSWRKGWLLPSSSFANLCNRCGQRWVKLNKNLIKDSQSPFVPSLIIKRNTGNDAILTTMTSLESIERLDDLDSKLLSVDNNISIVSNIISDDGGKSRPSSIPGGPFVAYAVQKLVDTSYSYVLFWVINRQETFILAAVGVDSRGSGHFVYTSTQYFAQHVAPLKCTKRMDVVSWLADCLGIAEQRHVDIPLQYSIDQLQALLSQTVDDTISEEYHHGNTHDSNPHHGPVNNCDDGHLENINKTIPGCNGLKAVHAIIASAATNREDALAWPSQTFKCSACGDNTHVTENCPSMCISPTALIQPVNDMTFISSIEDENPCIITERCNTQPMEIIFSPGKATDQDQCMKDLDFWLLDSMETQEKVFASYFNGHGSAWINMLSQDQIELMLHAWSSYLQYFVVNVMMANTNRSTNALSNKCISFGEVIAILKHLSCMTIKDASILHRTGIYSAVQSLYEAALPMAIPGQRSVMAAADILVMASNAVLHSPSWAHTLAR